MRVGFEFLSLWFLGWGNWVWAFLDKDVEGREGDSDPEKRGGGGVMDPEEGGGGGPKVKSSPNPPSLPTGEGKKKPHKQMNKPFQL